MCLVCLTSMVLTSIGAKVVSKNTSSTLKAPPTQLLPL